MYEGHPILSKIAILNTLKATNLENFQGSSPPSIFVGRFGYPNVSVSPLVTNFIDDVEVYDLPENWRQLNYNQIIELRAGLLRAHVGNFSVKKIDAVSEDFTLAKKSVDTEIFAKKVSMNIKFSNYHQPMGPMVEVDKLKITSNPTSNKTIEKVVDDEMRATEGISVLYKKNIEVSRISRILSAGMLGVKRKLVPTRWSITATDDIISKQLVEKIRDYPQINEYLIFENSRLGNSYTVLLFPEEFCFEQLEAWYKGSPWHNEVVGTGDYELFFGRKKYVENIAGAYYSGKLACLEHLESLKRKAGCIIFRHITQDYSIPLGVWQVRESVRQAFKNEPQKFSTLEEAFNYLKTHLAIPFEKWKEKSKVLNFVISQKKLNVFF